MENPRYAAVRDQGMICYWYSHTRRRKREGTDWPFSLMIRDGSWADLPYPSAKTAPYFCCLTKNKDREVGALKQSSTPCIHRLSCSYQSCSTPSIPFATRLEYSLKSERLMGRPRWACMDVTFVVCTYGGRARRSLSRMDGAQGRHGDRAGSSDCRPCRRSCMAARSGLYIAGLFAFTLDTRETAGIVKSVG
jgi:hypothetical protein